jgi:hypothetical protein
MLFKDLQNDWRFIVNIGYELVVGTTSEEIVWEPKRVTIHWFMTVGIHLMYVVCVWVVSTTFNDISVISWLLVLLCITGLATPQLCACPKYICL